jgi:uncharacterized protein DUF433
MCDPESAPGSYAKVGSVSQPSPVDVDQAVWTQGFFALWQCAPRSFVERTFNRITQNPSVLAGRATIRGLRISVAHVVNSVANGDAGPNCRGTA